MKATSGDYCSFKELTNKLYEKLVESRGNAHFNLGFPTVNILNEEPGEDVIYPALCQLSEMGIFLHCARAGSIKNKQELINDMKKLFSNSLDDQEEEDDENDDENDDMCDLQERRAYIECYMTQDFYNKLVKNIGPEFIVHGYEFRFGWGKVNPINDIAITITHFDNEVDESDRLVKDYLRYKNIVSPNIINVINDCSAANKLNIVKNLYHVYIFDTIWGRSIELFRAVIDSLESD